jgi:lipoteichoic acid synthase
MPVNLSSAQRAPFQWLATCVVPITLAALFAWRAELIESVAGTYTSCIGCFRLPVYGEDAWLMALVLTLLAAGCWFNARWLRILTRTLVALLALFATADVILIGTLTQRLHIDDIVRFGGDIDSNWSVVRAALSSPSGIFKALIAIGWIAALIVLCRPSPRRPRLAVVFAVLAISSALFTIYARTLPVRYVHNSFVSNVVETNLPQGRIREYSETHIAKQRDLLASVTQQCERNPATTRPNVIVLMVESLSAWHMETLGGTVNWMPKLDAIARDHHYFTNFYANGYNTSGGEVSLITGRAPMNPPGALTVQFDHYVTPEGALPEIARRAGYESSFFTPGNTDFLQLGNLLKALQFDVINGAEDPFYEGHRRWQFGAAEDRVFYDRYLQWMEQRTSEKPFLSVLLTVSSHPPFVDPHSAQINPEATMRYTDEQIAYFDAALRQRGFYDNGILLIVGDHRTMTPLAEDEFRRYGDRAFARVPMIVVGATDVPRVIDQAFQQTDLLPSLEWLLGGSSCTDLFHGNFLSAELKPPRYIAHVRGDDRNRIDIYHSGNAVAGYHLDGDDSRWIDAPPPDAASVAAWIDVQRQNAADRFNAKAKDRKGD